MQCEGPHLRVSSNKILQKYDHPPSHDVLTLLSAQNLSDSNFSEAAHRLSRNVNFAGHYPNREKLHASRTHPYLRHTMQQSGGRTHAQERPNQPVILGAQTGQLTELQRAGEWPGGLSTLPTSRLLYMPQSPMDDTMLRADCRHNYHSG